MMILGNAGVVAVMITATTSFVSTDIEVLPLNIAILALGIVVIYLIATRTGLARRWENFVEHRLGQSSLFEEGSVDELLHLIEGYGLIGLLLKPDSPLVDQTIGGTGIPERGFRILGIERGREWIAAPKSTQDLQADDRLVIYGRIDELRALARGV